MAEVEPQDPQSPNTNQMSFSEFIGTPGDVQFMRRYMAQFIKRRDHEKFIAELPPNVQRRILALKKLQMETLELDAEFHRKVYAMEKDYQEKHDSVFQKRLDIILGKTEPSEEEIAELVKNLKIAEGTTTVIEGKQEENPGTSVTGVPNFWLTIFKYVPKLCVLLKEADEPILKALNDIKILTQSDPFLSFTLQFQFAPNEYFSNEILEKEYFLKCAPDSDDPFAFDGPEIYKTRGTEILWFEGKNVTVEKGPGTGEEKKVQSFFNFFNPPELPEDIQSPLYDAVNAILSADFEIGHYIKDRVVPRAVLYFTGEFKDAEDEDSLITDSNLELVYEQDEQEQKENDSDAENPEN